MVRIVWKNNFIFFSNCLVYQIKKIQWINKLFTTQTTITEMENLCFYWRDNVNDIIIRRMEFISIFFFFHLATVIFNILLLTCAAFGIVSSILVIIGLCKVSKCLTLNAWAFLFMIFAFNSLNYIFLSCVREMWKGPVRILMMQCLCVDGKFLMNFNVYWRKKRFTFLR